MVSLATDFEVALWGVADLGAELRVEALAVFFDFAADFDMDFGATTVGFSFFDRDCERAGPEALASA